MGSGQDTTAERPTGLRALKKQRTREDLMRVALELFTAHGYEQTTVDEIADAVEVSQRTFFRYFASKEDVAFSVLSLVESQFVEALRLRPADESPFEAMRGAITSAWGSIDESIGDALPVELVMRTYRMIESTPVLLAAHLRRDAELADGIARLVADREGLDVDRDPRPRVAVAAVMGVMRTAGHLWGQRGHETSVETLVSLTETFLDTLTPSLLGPWHTDPAGSGGPAAGGRVCPAERRVG